MRITQSVGLLSLFLLVLRPPQDAICDTAIQSKLPVACSNETVKCHTTSPPPPLAIPHAQAQSGLASIETAASMAASQRESFAYSAPFVSQKAPIDKLNGIPAAFGDFDADHFVDVFLITENGHKIQALQGKDCSDGRTVLTYFGSRQCLANWTQIECVFSPDLIVNLVPSDFTGQNHLDLLVTVKTAKNDFDIYLAYGGDEDPTCNKKIRILTDVRSEPFVLDYNGDMIMDFIVSTATCNTFLWLGGTVAVPEDSSKENPTGQSDQPPKGVCLTNLTEKDFKFSEFHSSAFLNLNSYSEDMVMDIFLSGKDEIKYIYNVPGHGFSKKVGFSYPEQKLRGQSAFMDMNYSGQMNHLIPVCLDTVADKFDDCKQIGLMAWHESSQQWIDVLDSGPTNGGVNPNNRTLSFSEQFFFKKQLTVPVILRVGDLNYDGYPDFATILTDINVAGSQGTFAAIFLNVAIDQNDTKNNPFGRKFKLSWLSENVITEDVAMVTLFDLYNNGRLNLLLTKRIRDQEESLQTQSYDYYIEHSLYYSFLRVTVISGRCTDKEGGSPLCPKRNGKEQIALGTNPHGPSACFEGPYETMHSCSAQLIQSSHFSLQLPYMVFGLGDILNVVSELKISIPNGQNEARARTFDEEIPGSKLVIVPFELDAPSNWYKRVYISMGIFSVISLAFLFGLGLFLTIAIYILHYRERKEDRQDHLEYKKHWL